MEEFLRFLKDDINTRKKLYEKTKAESSQRLKMYETTLKTKGHSEAEILRALVGGVVEYQDLTNQASELSILNSIMVVAINTEMLRIRIDNINTQLTKSRILEKAKDIEEVKELKEKLTKTLKLLKGLFNEQKEMKEASKKGFPYIS